MKIDKTKLIQDIEVMKEKLASMEQELNKPDVFKHFPSKGDKYYVLCSTGTTIKLIADNDNIRTNIYKTKEEAHKAYDKDVALEKVKRRLLELQSDWKPDWKDGDEEKVYISYYHYTGVFEPELVYFSQSLYNFPYIKSVEIAMIIINEMQDELKVIFDIT